MNRAKNVNEFREKKSFNFNRIPKFIFVWISWLALAYDQSMYIIISCSECDDGDDGGSRRIKYIVGKRSPNNANYQIHIQSYRQNRHRRTEWASICLFICLSIIVRSVVRDGELGSNHRMFARLFVDINAFGFGIECHTFCVSYLWINKQTSKCMLCTH